MVLHCLGDVGREPAFNVGGGPPALDFGGETPALDKSSEDGALGLAETGSPSGMHTSRTMLRPPAMNGIGALDNGRFLPLLMVRGPAAGPLLRPQRFWPVQVSASAASVCCVEKRAGTLERASI